MATGGRILHHLIENIGRKENTILFVGYQAEGTLGQRLLSGSKNVRIMGKEVDVRAKIESLDGFSAHAGRSETLKWLRSFKKFPGTVFLNHGEPNATGALAEMLKQEFGAKVVIAKMGENYLLD
jgi:metallo-beta-lactamase family protein